MFDHNKETAQMLGRFQPWHDGHTALFKAAYNEVGQVCIMCRSVPVDSEANSRVPGQVDNPFTFEDVKSRITQALNKEGFEHGREYIVLQVPNIVDISYGRDVGYTFTQHHLGDDVHSISATAIRKHMRESGYIK
jgi:nicotinamide mononucleotide adenylyltransferase